MQIKKTQVNYGNNIESSDCPLSYFYLASSHKQSEWGILNENIFYNIILKVLRINVSIIP